MKRKIIAMTLMMGIAMLTAACGGQEQESSGGDNMVTVGMVADWQGTDHFQLDEIYQSQRLTGDSPIMVNPETMEFVVNLATDFTVSEDGSTVSFVLPQDAAFGHDGSLVSGADFKASLERGLKMSPYAEDYGPVNNVSVDGNKVTVNYDYFWSTGLFDLSSTFAVTEPKAQLENLSDDELLTQARPYGLFYISEYTPGSHVKLLKNEGYKTNNPLAENKGAALVDGVLCKVMPDGFSRVSALKSGEIDVALLVPGESIAELEADSNITVLKYATPGMRSIDVNATKPMLSDINVREAISLALDREAIAGAANGILNPAYAYVVPEMLDYSQEAADYYKTNFCNNVDKAKELLAGAGWADANGDGYLEKDGKMLECSLLSASSLPDGKTTTQLTQDQLKKIGMKVNIETLEYGYLRDRISNGEYDLAYIGFTWPEPCSMLPYIIRNEAAFKNIDKYMALFPEAAAIRDSTARTAKVAEAQKILMDEFIMIPAVQSVDALAYRNNIKGLKLFADTDLMFNDVTKE